MEFQRAGHYDLMCVKTRALGWNENYGIQGNGIKDSRRKIIIQENYVTEHYDRLKNNLEFETEGEVDAGEKRS